MALAFALSSATAASCWALRSRQLLFEPGNFAVLELSGTLEIAFAGFFELLEAEGFELLLELGDAADGAALGLPTGAEGGGALLDLGELALDGF